MFTQKYKFLSSKVLNSLPGIKIVGYSDSLDLNKF